MRTLLIASAAPGDGKTTIARHLAGAAAKVGSRVLLLEADLRRPVLAQQLDAQPGPGLADVLIGAVSLNEAIQTIDLEAPSSGEGAQGRTLDVLDGVVIVGRVGRNRRDVAQRLHETLAGAGAPLLGVIANGFKARRNAPYAYAYDYSYTPDKQPAGAPAAGGASPNGATSAGGPAAEGEAVPTAKT
ncbi:MAG: tyrosine-protein kinase family protein [Solirubrobacteraceae bacterium]